MSVTYPEIAEVYLPKLGTTEGPYLGKEAFSSHDGFRHEVSINTTENDIDIEISPKKVIPFDFCDSPGEEFSDSGPERSTLGSQGCLSSYAKRVKRVKKSL